MIRHHPHHHSWRDLDNAPPEVESKRKNIETVVDDLVTDSKKARHMCRLALEDGPWHRNEANTAILSGLIEVLKVLERRTGCKLQPYKGPVEDVDLHLPPHLAGHRGRSYARIELPVRLLQTTFESKESFDHALEAISEGPHHEVASNAIFVMLIEALQDIISNTSDKESPEDGEC